MQVVAGNLAPITALVQNLIMSALFQPFEALCSQATAEIDEVDAHATCSMHYPRHGTGDIGFLVPNIPCLHTTEVQIVPPTSHSTSLSGACMVFMRMAVLHVFSSYWLQRLE